MDAFVDFELARLDDERAQETLADVELADVREPGGHPDDELANIEPANPDPGVPGSIPERPAGIARLICRHGNRGLGCPECAAEYEQITSAPTQADAEWIAAELSGPVSPAIAAVQADAWEAAAADNRAHIRRRMETAAPSSVGELSAWMSDWIANEAQRAGIPADLVPAIEDTSGAAFARATNYRGLSARQVIVDDVAGPGEYPNRICRSCGCSDLDCSGCIARTGRPCSWTEPGLCSACAQVGPPAPRAMVPRTAVDLEPHPPGFCYVCGKELTGDRKLLCADCGDPNGAVARHARMFRGTTAGAAVERLAQSGAVRGGAIAAGPFVVPDRVCIVPGCGQAIGPTSWDGRHCTSCYAGELGDPRAPR